METRPRQRSTVGKFVVAAVSAVLIGACASKASTSPQEAASLPGSTRTVCAKVAEVIEDPISDGPLHLYLDRPAPDQSLIVTIQDRKTAGNLRYLARTICVTGQIQQSSDGTRIIVQRAAQVSVSPDPIPEVDVAQTQAHRGQAVRVCGPLHSLEWKPGSDLEATLVVGSGDSDSSLWVNVLDRRGLEIQPGMPVKKVCVTGFIRSDSADRPLVVVRDTREVTAEK
ncbi:MAG: hypothetical protein C4319_04965 [Acidimicrobiia bacterium]